MTMSKSHFPQHKEALSVTAVSRGIDRIEVTFDDPNLVANAGLLLVATLVVRLRLERLINSTLDLSGRVGGALPGRKVLTLVHTMVAGGSHHRPRRPVAGRGDPVGAPTPGVGAFHFGDVSPCRHLRPCPPARLGARRNVVAGVGPRGR